VREAVFVCRTILLAWSAATAASFSPPTIDGVIGPKEWSSAQREKLTGGGEVLLLRAGADLYVAVIGAKPGYPSLCVGDFRHVEVLHASAALGSVSYTRTGASWLRGKPFEWRVRDKPRAAAALLADRESFLAEYGWLSTASRAGAPTREFRIKLGPERRFLSVVFLSSDTKETAYWPASMSDGCRDLGLLRGDAPEAFQLDPSQWHRIK
jgi:hypothetical protein